MGAWEWEDEGLGDSVGFQDDYAFAEIIVLDHHAEIHLELGTEDGLTVEMVKAVIEALFAQVEAARKEVK